ncbi:sugar glycosyltransferase [Candidatus Pantoea deserta]|uniref:Sugar glycosyltransferase n=1 Tax=Candidatus Pantoea deserta TaxID=1869313 RepID=A0A3N4PN47_9GAMM|nr:sugar glycosyltransferase [Pantoea deserta]RPE00994.1 sugar glycosyltransferase [Pantoea deserta]
MGSLWKQIYRYTHPRSYRHSENLWPHVRITRAPEGHIRSLVWKGKPIAIEDLSALRGTHREPLAIVATGPSVKTLDKQKLSQFTSLGVNGAYHLRDRIKFDYYVIVDRDFVADRQEIVRQIVQDRDLLLFITVQCLHDIFCALGSDAVKCRLAIVEDIRHKVFQPLVKPADYARKSQQLSGLVVDAENSEIGYCRDIRQGVVDAGTVAYWALQIAHYLGAPTILIAGVDMNNFSSPRFYENAADVMPSLLETCFLSLIKPSFSHASRIMKEENIVVYNLSPDSALESHIFKKVSLNDL